MSRKYQTWSNGEATAAGGATFSMTIGSDAADEDTTVVSLNVTLGLSVAPSGVVGTAANSAMTGLAYVQVLRSGQSVSGQVTASQAFFDTGISLSMNDGDQGDIWVAQAFALTQGTSALIQLRPSTARKLRKGDVLLCVVEGTNFGPDSGTINASGVWTIFTQA